MEACYPYNSHFEVIGTGQRKKGLETRRLVRIHPQNVCERARYICYLSISDLVDIELPQLLLRGVLE